MIATKYTKKHCLRLNFIDVATGSLGQGLSVACGMAYAGKHFDKVGVVGREAISTNHFVRPFVCLI